MLQYECSGVADSHSFYHVCVCGGGFLFILIYKAAFFLCGCTDVNSHQLLIYAWNTSHDGKSCSYVLHPPDSLVVIPPPHSLSASVHLSLSLPPSLHPSRLLPPPLSGAATTCLGFDVSVCIVTEAMPPSTADLRCIFWSALIPCRTQPKKKRVD